MAATRTARRLEAVRGNLDLAVKDAIRAMPTEDLDKLQAILAALSEPRRRLSAEQAAMWREFCTDYQRRYAELVAAQREDDKIIIWP